MAEAVLEKSSRSVLSSLPPLKNHTRTQRQGELMSLKFLIAVSSLLLPLSSMASDCVLPFTKMINPLTGTAFAVKDTYNNLSGVKDMYRGRYIVVNLNTRDDNGNCKGVQEHYPSQTIDGAINFFPELATPNGAQTYMSLPHYKAPLSRASIVNNLCLGQMVSLCELRGNGQVVEVAKLATSSLETGSSHPEYGYYAELNIINTRSWGTGGQRPAYTDADAQRDMEMGGVEESKMSGARHVYYKGWAMPNFMNFVAVPGYKGNALNGFHELSAGETFSPNMGGPVSHGCLRLTKYGSVLLRWWAPRGARTFMHFTPEGYKKFANQ